MHTYDRYAFIEFIWSFWCCLLSLLLSSPHLLLSHYIIDSTLYYLIPSSLYWTIVVRSLPFFIFRSLAWSLGPYFDHFGLIFYLLWWWSQFFFLAYLFSIVIPTKVSIRLFLSLSKWRQMLDVTLKYSKTLVRNSLYFNLDTIILLHTCMCDFVCCFLCLFFVIFIHTFCSCCAYYFISVSIRFSSF